MACQRGILSGSWSGCSSQKIRPKRMFGVLPTSLWRASTRSRGRHATAASVPFTWSSKLADRGPMRATLATPEASMHRVRRSIVIFLCVTAALVLASPPTLYCLGLSGVDGRPQKPLQLVSNEQQELVWKRARAKGTPRIDAMNPYSFVITLLTKKDASSPPDQLIVWWVASGYLLSHQRYQGMIWWHLSGAALSIWVSRNWTSEEILSAAAVPRLSALERAFNRSTPHIHEIVREIHGESTPAYLGSTRKGKPSSFDNDRYVSARCRP